MGFIRNDVSRNLCWKKYPLDYHPRHRFEGGKREGRKCSEELMAVPREREQCPCRRRGVTELSSPDTQ